MKTFQSLPSMRFNSEWKKTFINKYNVSKTDASSTKAVQECEVGVWRSQEALAFAFGLELAVGQTG